MARKIGIEQDPSASATKMCWKCGRMHQDGASSCPYCGASFLSGEAHYSTDGRSTTMADESHYLRTSPPRYRKGPSPMMILAIVIVAVVILLMIMVAPWSNGGTYLVHYTAEKTSVMDGGNYYDVSYYMTVENEGPDSVSLSNIVFKIVTNGIYYTPVNGNPSVTLKAGQHTQYTLTYHVWKGDYTNYIDMGAYDKAGHRL